MSLFDKYKKTADKTIDAVFGANTSGYITVAEFLSKGGGVLTPDTLLYHKYKGGEIDSCDIVRFNKIEGYENEFYVPSNLIERK